MRSERVFFECHKVKRGGCFGGVFDGGNQGRCWPLVVASPRRSDRTTDAMPEEVVRLQSGRYTMSRFQSLSQCTLFMHTRTHHMFCIDLWPYAMPTRGHSLAVRSLGAWASKMQ